jgi:hypothetical protein
MSKQKLVFFLLVMKLQKNLASIKQIVADWLKETNSQNKYEFLKAEQTEKGFTVSIRNRGLANITFLMATLTTNGYSILGADIIGLYNDPEGYSNILKIQLL